MVSQLSWKTFYQPEMSKDAPLRYQSQDIWRTFGMTFRKYSCFAVWENCCSCIMSKLLFYFSCNMKLNNPKGGKSSSDGYKWLLLASLFRVVPLFLKENPWSYRDGFWFYMHIFAIWWLENHPQVSFTSWCYFIFSVMSDRLESHPGCYVTQKVSGNLLCISQTARTNRWPHFITQSLSSSLIHHTKVQPYHLLRAESRRANNCLSLWLYKQQQKRAHCLVAQMETYPEASPGIAQRGCVPWLFKLGEETQQLFIFAAHNQCFFSVSVQWELHVVFRWSEQSNHNLLCNGRISLCESWERKTRSEGFTFQQSLTWQKVPMHMKISLTELALTAALDHHSIQGFLA